MLRWNLLLLLLKASSEMTTQCTATAGPDAMRHLSKITVSPVSAGLVSGPPLEVGSLWKDKPTLLFVSKSF